MLRQDDYQRSKLVTVMWQWGRDYGGHLAACMIGSTIANRVRAGWGTWLEVIDRIPNFAATTVIPTGTPNIWEPQFVRLLHEVDAIYDGTKDYASGALYWADTRDITTPFFKDKILPEHKTVGSLNSLTFWR